MHLPRFEAARVLVAGDVMLDRYWSGTASRISPEAPVPVVKIAGKEARPGGAANVALNIAALGGKAGVLGLVGADEPGRLLAEALSARGVLPLLMEGAAPTITKLRVLARHQQLLRVDFEEALAPQLDVAAFAARFAEQLAGSDAVVLSDYGKGTLTGVAGLVAAARAAKKSVLIDPKGSDWQPYAGATLITPNLAELQAVAGPCETEAQIVEKGERLRRELGLSALLITRSEQGMTLLTGGAPLHLPALAREVFDVTGAGDTVIATVAAALACGTPLADCARLANVAAGIVVGKLGTATVSREELAAALAPLPHSGARVVSEAALVALVAAARSRGEAVVMTNGCFDILHVGHLRYLEAAKALGDLLVVAVNSDDSVRRLKGPHRPLNNADDRMAMLAGLQSVDYVVAFAEDTPERLIGAVLPNILVKGGDYKPEQIAGYEAVTRAGGQVLALEFYNGYSTTRLIERARV